MGKKARSQPAGSVGVAFPGEVLRFGNVALHQGRRELRVADAPVAIEPKPLDLLILLLSRPGELFGKQELFEQIWAGRVVTDSVLTRCVAKLRQALGPEGERIETVHGFGYRFAGDVVLEDAEISTPRRREPLPTDGAASSVEAAAVAAPVPTDNPPPQPRYRVEVLPFMVTESLPRRTWRRLPLIVALAAATIITVAFLLLRGAGMRNSSIAVLPFENIGPEAQANDYLAGGLHDNILSHLAGVDGLKVISRTSVMRYRGTTHNIREIGKALGVGHVLEGSVQRVGARVMVNAQLIDAVTDQHLWAEVYDRPLDDLFDLQSEIAARVALSVGARLSAAQTAALWTKPTQSAEAYQTYLQARDEERRDGLGQESLMRIQALLQRALDEDEKFALAHAMLARTHILIYWFGYDAAPERRERAKTALARSLELQPDLPEALFAQGVYRAAGFRDYIGAVQSYERALKLQPSSSAILRYLGSAYRRQGQWSEAIKTIGRAAVLDPLNASILQDLADLNRALQRYKDAAHLYDKVVELTPGQSFPLINRAQNWFEWTGDLEPLKKILKDIPDSREGDDMAASYRYQVAYWEGRYADALALLLGQATDWNAARGGSGEWSAMSGVAELHELLGHTEAALKNYQRARAFLENSLRTNPDQPDTLAGLALVQAALGEKDRALTTMQRALNLAPQSLDALRFGSVVLQSALLYARIGDTESALDTLERYIGMPYSSSTHWMQRLPALKPLHDHPRFKNLIATHSPLDQQIASSQRIRNGERARDAQSILN